MSSRKGGQFEREICVLLSRWWTQRLRKPRDDIFWRTAGSGARATTRTKSGKRTRGQYGDIGAIDPIGAPLMDAAVLELKRGYTSHTIMDLLDCSPNKTRYQYEEWIHKIHQSHLKSGSMSWLLIVRRNNRQAAVFLPMWFWLLIDDGNNGPWPVPLLQLTWPADRTSWGMCNGGIVGMQLSGFLNMVDPERIREIAKT